MEQNLLGNHPIAYELLPHAQNAFLKFTKSDFQQLSTRKKFKFVNQTLLELIETAKEPCFLLPAVLEFIERVNQEKILPDPYHFLNFEFWINRFSKLSETENLKIRAKIVGKWIPREEYQVFFPIGTGTTFSGTHFVAAHASPDIDTTIASFWGWVDAFGAKVAEGVHQWSLPGTFPESHFTFLFHKLFSPAVFTQLARTSPTLTLTALDLVTQNEMLKVNEQTSIRDLNHNHTGKAIVIVDDNDFFKGDWRSTDAEQVGQVMVLFTAIIRFWENHIHSKLIATFAKKSIHLTDVQESILSIFNSLIHDAEPVHDYSEKQKQQLDSYLRKIVHLEKGINSSFIELGTALDLLLADKRFHHFSSSLHSFINRELYGTSDQLIEDRPKIFSYLEKTIKDLNNFVIAIRTSINRLSIMVQVKKEVLGIPSPYVTLKSDVDEIRSKMGSLEYITVVIAEEDGKYFPVGVIHAQDLKRPILGTVSLRDFSNEQETKMASYLGVISVIDHHKTNLKTNCASFFLISDVQSCNTLVAEQAFLINERYSSLGLSLNQINQETKKLTAIAENSEAIQPLIRLLQLQLNARLHSSYFIHPEREFAEYLCFLYAILDDTDLLTKVTARDVECVVQLLNRMKSLATLESRTIISLDGIPRNAQFAKAAAAHILQNQDMYSLYKTIYEFKEEEVKNQLLACIQRLPSTIFADTKEQNGCCYVGQTKIFKKSFPFFTTHANTLRTIWLQEAQRIYTVKPAVDFHLHMISTIASADEVYSNHIGNWEHKDEIWIWTPSTQQGMEHLTGFLNAFHPTLSAQDTGMEVELTGNNSHELCETFRQNFPNIAIRINSSSEGLPIAILRFKAGAINSRKAQISPYLPKLIP